MTGTIVHFNSVLFFVESEDMKKARAQQQIINYQFMKKDALSGCSISSPPEALKFPCESDRSK